MSYPSIFNDVLGPVMRGPSSSHCAASLRIGRICRDLMAGQIDTVLVEYDPNGSLATTHKSQGSDMGLFSGLLGREADDERLQHYQQGVIDAGLDIEILIRDIGADHPNTYQLTLSNAAESHQMIALSTGGGMIEVINIDGAQVQMAGDFWETLVYAEKQEDLEIYLTSLSGVDDIISCEGNQHFFQLKSQQALDPGLLEEISQFDQVQAVKQIAPVLPILSRKNLTVPFISCEEMLAYNESRQLELWQLALRYESERGNISEEEVWQKMVDLVNIMRSSIEYGLLGTQYKDRILGPQSLGFQEKMAGNGLVHNQVLNQIILYVSAMMEVKSAMGVIVAAPTAGACGALPGAILGASSAMELPEETAVKAMLAAGMIGLFIAAHSTFAAEVGGCQAETGSGGGMAAAGIVELAGGSLSQALAASSMALQNSLGVICDPVANRVEAPCLGRNVMAASNALSCANMALADYDPLIPLDQVIETMNEVGERMAHELRCTGLGGLSMTPASKAIEADLAEQEGLQETARKFKIC